MNFEKETMICNGCGDAINIITSGSVTVRPSQEQKDNGTGEILHFHSKCHVILRKEMQDMQKKLQQENDNG